jgi:TonB family protein
MVEPGDYITRVRIDLEPDGRLADVVVTRPTRSRELDGQDTAAVRRAAPFAKPQPPSSKPMAAFTSISC